MFSRQAVEYVYFTLAIVACLGLVFAVLTHCQFAASFFTALLLILIVLFTLVAIILYATASIGNDGCAALDFKIALRRSLPETPLAQVRQTPCMPMPSLISKPIICSQLISTATVRRLQNSYQFTKQPCRLLLGATRG